MESVVVSVEIRSDFGVSLILTNTANGNTNAIVEIRVGDRDVRAVGLQCDAVVAVANVPSVEVDVVGEQSVGSVSVDCASSIRDTGNVDVLHQNILGGVKSHGPTSCQGLTCLG